MEQPFFADLLAARSGRAAIAAFVRGNTEILARSAATKEVAESAPHELDAAAVVAHSERLRCEGLAEVVRLLADRFRLRARLRVDAATDLLLMLSSSATYLTLQRYGWSDEKYVEWLTDALAQQLLSRPISRRSSDMRIAAGAVSVLLGLGFGLPCIVGIRQFARSGEVWTFLGFPTYGNGPFHRIGLPTSIPLLMGFLAVCLAELAVGAMIWLDARPSSVRWRCCRSSSSSGWDSHCRLVRRSEPPAPVRVPKEPAFESPDSTPPPEAQAVSTAARFAAAWARPDLPADQWSTGVKPWCTARYGALLEHLDSGSIPARRVSGPPKPAHRKPGMLSYAVSTDAGTLLVTVIAQRGQWKVTRSSFLPSGDVRAPQPQPAPIHTGLNQQLRAPRNTTQRRPDPRARAPV